MNLKKWKTKDYFIKLKSLRVNKFKKLREENNRIKKSTTIDLTKINERYF